MSSNLKARGLVLRAGEKNLRDNVPIRFNDWATFGGSKKDPDLYSKVNTIKFSVLTHNHGVGLKTTWGGNDGYHKNYVTSFARIFRAVVGPFGYRFSLVCIFHNR